MPLFRVVTQRVVVISYRRFGTTYRSHPHGSRIKKAEILPFGPQPHFEIFVVDPSELNIDRVNATFIVTSATTAADSLDG
jgi:hypothetical protein